MDAEFKKMPFGGLNESQVEAISRFLIAPVIESLKSFEKRMEEKLDGHMRLTEKLNENNSAMLRAITDPITGYVPRSEVSLSRETVEVKIDKTNVRIDELNSKTDARFDSLRAWIISSAIAFVAMMTTVAGLFFHFIPTK